jgi:iron complex outermembrane receptor protein
VPGFDVRRSKEQTQLVTVRGITSESNEHLLIMMDGVRLGNMYEGGAGKDTRQISLEDVQRIEIIRGPGSALYGTGAFAAVVSVITKKGSDTAGVHVTGEAGSYGGRATKVRAGQKFGDLNINGNFGYAESTGENFFIGQDGAGQSGNIRDPYMEIFGNLKLSYSEFELSSAISHQTYPAFITTGDVFDPISFGKSSWFITSLDHRHEFSKSLSWQSKLAFAYDERGPTLAMIWPPGLNAKFPAGQYGHPHLDDHRYSLDTYVSYVPIKDMTLIAGGAAELNTTSNYDHPSNGPNRTGVPESKFFDDSTRRIVVAGYAQGDYRFFKGLKLTAGVRYDHYNDFGGTTNPRVALVYNYRDKAWIKALYATAFRAPSYRELYATSPTNKGDPANKPETITTGELVFGAAPWRQLTATVSLFDSEVKNLIYRNQAAAADGSYPLQNHGNLTAMGVEAEIKSEILPGLELAGNYTYVHSRTSVFGNTYDTPVVSHHVANFTISRDLYHHLRLSVLGEYRSAKTRYVVAGDPASDPRSPCGEVFLVGAYARVYDLVEGVAGYVRVTNALDSQYSTPSAYPAKVKGVTPDDIHNRGIEIQAGLTYSFK